MVRREVERLWIKILKIVSFSHSLWCCYQFSVNQLWIMAKFHNKYPTNLLICPNLEKMISRSSDVVTGLSLQTNSTFSGGLASASGKSPICQYQNETIVHGIQFDIDSYYITCSSNNICCHYPSFKGCWPYVGPDIINYVFYSRWKGIIRTV